MLNTVAYLILNLVPTVGALTYTTYLMYVKLNRHHHQMVMEKHESKYKDTPFYEMRVGMYSTRSLIGWTFISLVFILGIVRELF